MTATITGLSDPALAAWLAAGGPGAGLDPDHDGECARCRRHDDLIRSHRVVSTQFTGYDTWSRPDGRGLCQPCTWVYREKRLRARPHLISRDQPGLVELTLPQLRTHLSAPLNTGQALSAPLRAGRRHVLPTAAWGRACVDGTPIPWTWTDVALLEVVERLRGRGISWRAFSDPTPPWAPLSRLPGGEQAETLADWQELAPWRDPTRALWLRLALLATSSVTSTTKEMR